MKDESYTDFGFEQVSKRDKTERVGAVFGSVARRYDLMNDLMSFGLHRLWKAHALSRCQLKPGNRVLDLAGGTGDLACAFQKQVGPSGQTLLLDINAEMLNHARVKLIDRALLDKIDIVQGSAEQLPLASDSLNCVAISFGLRNVTDKSEALKSIYRVLKPGGRLVILEFSKPEAWLAPIYDAYSFSILPKLGQMILQDGASYQYLAESIRMHPDQAQLIDLMATAGFENNHYQNLTQGIVALHVGFKF